MKEILHNSVSNHHTGAGQVVALVGFDDEAQTFLVADPWNAQFGGKVAGLRAISYQEFSCIIVNCTLGVTSAAFPLKIGIEISPLSGSTSLVDAFVSLRAPKPLKPKAVVLKDVWASIQVPSGLALTSEIRQNYSTLAPNEIAHFQWEVAENDAVDGKIAIAIAAIAHASDPYPYSEVIGTSASIDVKSLKHVPEHETTLV
ncbi:MAG TPA: hypothetical protein VMV52_02960 [Candidatus Nanopelagicaceae bacterium]|nr:hypothetical protein [Candidatus Nanopelagicaceae bacterium]